MRIPEEIAEQHETMTDEEILAAGARAGLPEGYARFLLELVRGRVDDILGPII